MILEPIAPHHRTAIEQLRKAYGHETASHAFLSLFLWQEEMGLQLHLEPELFTVKCCRSENCWFFPCGSRAAIAAFVQHQLDTAQAPLRFCYLRREDTQLLEALFPGRFAFTEVPEDGEYLYDRQAQTLLQGKDFRHHRNSLNRLQQTFRLEVRELAPENLADAARVIDLASREQAIAANGFSADSAEQALLDNWSWLGIGGILVYADGQPAAVAAGYPLSQRTYDISLCCQCRSDPAFAVYARHQLFSRLPEHITVINAEEDLGLEGLRSLKQGMRPTELLTMFEGVSQ